MLALTLLAGPAVAVEHGALKRALQGASCIPATTRVISQATRTTVYEVACRDRLDRPLTIVCTAGRCLVDDHARHDDDDDDDEDDG